MRDFFWVGFTKEGYDYRAEAMQKGQQAEFDAQREPAPMGKSVGTGAGIGGIAGAGIGALGAKPGMKAMGAGKGALMGAGFGLLAGAIHALADELKVEDAKNLMSLEPDEREAILASRARKEEQRGQEFRQDLKQERRHREMMANMGRNQAVDDSPGWRL